MNALPHSSRCGLLAGLSGAISALVLVLMAAGRGGDAMAIPAADNATESMSGSSSLFDLPMRIDEDELLQNYGSFMLSAMNRSIDPCEDFYEYACGNWKHAALVPQRSRNDTFLHSIQSSIDQLMTAFLGNATSGEASNVTDGQQLQAGSAEQKAKAFYTSCLAMNKDMEKGYQQLLLMDVFAGKLEAKANETLDWMNMNFLSPYGLHPLLPLKVHYSTESRKLELMISAPAKILGTSDIVDVKNLTRDFKIEDEEQRQKFVEEYELMVSFEKNLTAYASKRNETEELTLGEFLKTHQGDTLNWTRYFHVAFNGSEQKVWVIHNTVQQADKLDRFLRKAEVETLRTYVKWRTMLKFYYIWKADFGNKSVENTCREHTEQYFNYALIPWFIDQTYDADKRADILQVAKQVKLKFYDLIDKYTWLDDETKSGAKSKLRAMDLQVGYTDEMRHRDVIDQVYGDLNITADWFRNVQAVEANRARVRMKSVNKAIIPPLMSTRSVNAYYADFLNLVFITVGIAQLPFYHMRFPAALKFGGIGNIIGHEMAHGFDSYCYQYNYDGKKQNWWSVASLRNFRERYQCLESQYNKLIYRGVATNGTLTSGDNIADNVGTRISYHAYMQAYGQKEGDLKPIPGLDYTNKQLYFLKFAQTWCTGKDEAYKVRRMRNDAHAYEEFRVVGTLTNMPEFSEVFKCKLGSDMNPLKKCVVW